MTHGERTIVCAGVEHHVRMRTLLPEKPPAGSIDLHGGDLRSLDLRSLDLRGADLRDADLRDARTGLSSAWRARLALFSVTLSIAVGALTGVAGARLRGLITSESQLERLLALFVCAELVMFLLVALWRGIDRAVRRVLAPVCVAAVVISVVGALAGGTGAAGGAILAFSTLIFATIALATLVRVVASSAGKLLLLLVVLASTVASGLLHGGLVALAVALSALLLSRRTLRYDPELPYLSRLSRELVSRGGTSLRDADLRGARLQGCLLHCTDLRGARLDGAQLTGAREVMCALDPGQRSLLGGTGQIERRP